MYPRLETVKLAVYVFLSMQVGSGGAFANANKRGHTLVNEQVNMHTPPNVDVLSFLLYPGDKKKHI